MSFLRKIAFPALMAIFLTSGALAQQAAPLRIVALGDSLTAGYGLQGGQDFATQLQTALMAQKLNVKVENASVSGDTTAGGLARIDWAIGNAPKPDLVIVALGGNDLLRAVPPATAKSNLQAILQKLKSRDIPALLVGMRAPGNLGPVYQKQFDAIYPDLAREFNVPLYPFFLDGIAMNAKYNLPDGIHPTAEGIQIIVGKMLPTVMKALNK